jgi:hypothetical protein
LVNKTFRRAEGIFGKHEIQGRKIIKEVLGGEKLGTSAIKP